MQTSLSQFPNLRILTVGLTSVFRINGYTSGEVTVLDRQPNIYASTFPSEIVTCRIDSGNELRLLCKYGVGHTRGHGHRGGVVYEAEVYRHVLQPSEASTPTFYGAHIDTTTGRTWLILEYMDKSVRVGKAMEPSAMALAASWIGRFHAANEARLSSVPMPFLNTYDAEYYRGWARRTSIFAGHLHERFPWLTVLRDRFGQLATDLLTPAPTVIHAEFWVSNVLIRGGTVYPVDWESAAVGVGEIDLAALTEGWSAETVRECKVGYQRARWSAGAPADFERTFGAARLYWCFRWLDDRPNRITHHEKSLRLFEQLRSAGERLGLI